MTTINETRGAPAVSSRPARVMPWAAVLCALATLLMFAGPASTLVRYPWGWSPEEDTRCRGNP